ncbi:MAG: Ig-like domain-containing protein [Bacteroidales bacterium]|jgi:hypothetical protein|nr:Ig-like domain-containing protein [Bacteroidales bacterium]
MDIIKPQPFLYCLLIIFFLLSACKEKVTDIFLNKNILELVSGETETLIATVYPKDAAYKKIIWESSNPAVAIVTENGLVIAINDGSAIITVTTDGGGKTATCSVKIDYRFKWTGEYEGIHLQRIGPGPIEPTLPFDTFPCSIYVTLRPPCVEPPNPWCDSFVIIEFLSPAKLPFTNHSFQVDCCNGLLTSSKWCWGHFYKDSIYVKQLEPSVDMDSVSENHLYAKKNKKL